MTREYDDTVTFEPLIASLDNAIRTDVIGDSVPALYVAHARLIATIKSAVGENISIGVTGASIGFDAREVKNKCTYELLENLVGVAPDTLLSLVCESIGENRKSIELDALLSGITAASDSVELASGNRSERWCQAVGLHTGSSYNVPASAVLPAWQHYVGDKISDFNCDASGLAASACSDVERSWCHGLCEVLERDAMMLSWRLPDWQVADLGDAASQLPELGNFLDAHDLSGHLLDVGDPMLAPVIICILSDPAGKITCGSSCGLDLAHSMSKSVLEAIMLWNTVRGDKSESTPQAHWQTNWRSSDHVLYGWRNSDTVKNWFGVLPRRPIALQPTGLNDLVIRCMSRFYGWEPVMVDLSVGKMEAIGAYVCRVLQANACRKELNGLRPIKMGRRLAYFASASSSLNLLPHPFG
jgi:YcaO cyclodehydratase, ATP-ad Mg2+-binding